jgi:hypothetical protein
VPIKFETDFDRIELVGEGGYFFSDNTHTDNVTLYGGDTVYWVNNDGYGVTPSVTVSYYKNGTHLDSDKFKAIVTPNKFSTVHMIFDNETNVSVDGELISTKELHLSVDKNALGFILPRGANKQGLVELEEKQAASV